MFIIPNEVHGHSIILTISNVIRLTNKSQECALLKLVSCSVLAHKPISFNITASGVTGRVVP